MTNTPMLFCHDVDTKWFCESELNSERKLSIAVLLAR